MGVGSWRPQTTELPGNPLSFGFISGADWLVAAGSIGTLIIAAVALNPWRAQSRGAAAKKIKTAAWGLRYAF